jgi:hypothetical protein
METIKKMFLKKWMYSNLTVYPVALGIFHPLIAHGFTGDHDKILTTPQFMMHTLSMFVFVLLLTCTQNKALQLVSNRNILSGIWPIAFVAPWGFWFGYYTLYVPFDILFMMLSIGIINGVQMRPFVKNQKKWLWQSLLTYFLAAVAGISIGIGSYLLYLKDIQGIGRDMGTWLMISIPSGVVIALLSRLFLMQQIVVSEDGAEVAIQQQESHASFAKMPH